MLPDDVENIRRRDRKGKREPDGEKGPNAIAPSRSRFGGGKMIEIN